jgi:DNA-binding beta-propeller fold protein YncE
VNARALVAVVALASAACNGEAHVVRTYDAYDGSAPYPNTRPAVALPAGDFALVPSSGADRLTVVDLGARRVLAQVPIGRNPVVLDGPHQIVADMKKRVAYVVYAYPATVEAAGNHSHGSSQRNGWVQTLALDDLRATGEVEVDANPGEIALSDDGRRLVVTHFDLTSALAVDTPIESRRSTLALIDPDAVQPFGTPQPDTLLVCVAPHGVALSRPDAKTAFVACFGEDAIAVVDLSDVHAPVLRVPVGEGAGPYGVALSPNGARLAIGTRGAKDLRFLDVASRTMEALVIPAAGETYVPAWSPDGAGVYLPTRALDTVSLVDAKTGASKKQRVFAASECVAPMEVARGTDASVVHVVCEGDAQTPGVLLTVDAETLETRARVEVGSFPGRPFVGRGP